MRQSLTRTETPVKAKTAMGDARIHVSVGSGVLPVVKQQRQSRSTPMPRQAATTGSLPQAFEGVKEMQAGGPDRGTSSPLRRPHGAE